MCPREFIFSMCLAYSKHSINGSSDCYFSYTPYVWPRETIGQCGSFKRANQTHVANLARAWAKPWGDPGPGGHASDLQVWKAEEMWEVSETWLSWEQLNLIPGEMTPSTIINYTTLFRNYCSGSHLLTNLYELIYMLPININNLHYIFCSFRPSPYNQSLAHKSQRTKKGSLVSAGS